jgi:ubiquinone/menaquinone biosynthesis C-methylase UbiE
MRAGRRVERARGRSRGRFAAVHSGAPKKRVVMAVDLGLIPVMASSRNPQAEQMADESMVRNLAAQAQAIWPQEQPLLRRYQIPADAKIVDIGCGTGEMTGRLAAAYPAAKIVGVDILDSSLAYARQRYAELGSRVQFTAGDAFALTFPENHFDLIVCRHLTQCVPEPEKVLGELHRVCKPRGWLHVLSEDYGMLHFMTGELDPDVFWHEGVTRFARSTGTDQRIGRRTWTLLRQLGLEHLSIDYITVDTQRVPRPTFAAILTAWRDGYTETISRHSHLSPSQVRAYFDQMIATILDADQYAVWHIPVISGQKRS